jgi:hypothetical protein
MHTEKNVNLKSILGTMALKTKPRKVLNNETFKTLETQTILKLLRLSILDIVNNQAQSMHFLISGFQRTHYVAGNEIL